MTRVDRLITGGHVLTMDDSFSEFADGAVAIADGKIIECGEAGDLAARFIADHTQVRDPPTRFYSIAYLAWQRNSQRCLLRPPPPHTTFPVAEIPWLRLPSSTGARLW